MERAVFSTLFSCGFKKKSEASEEQVAESQQKRNEREEREAKELSDKAKGKRTAETSEPSGVIHKLDISERRRRRRRKIQPAGRQAGRRSVWTPNIRGSGHSPRTRYSLGRSNIYYFLNLYGLDAPY